MSYSCSGMLNLYFIFVTVATLLRGSLCGHLVEVVVKSHSVLTKDLAHHSIASFYDNNIDTPAALSSSNETNVEILFDLGKNHVIDHVLFTVSNEKRYNNISLLVGNSVDGQGSLLYICVRPNGLGMLIKCEPECRRPGLMRPGIIARTFVMRMLGSEDWDLFYDMKVFSSPLVSVSDDISSNRLILPSDCGSRSWLLSDKSSPANFSLATVTKTDVYFEKPYVVTEIDVQFDKIIPTTLEVTLETSAGKSMDVVFNVSDCWSRGSSMFTCKVNTKTMVSRRVQLSSVGVLKIHIRGKAAFYPKIDIKTSRNMKEHVTLSCEYSPCDESIHRDCSHLTINSGIRFQCANKRLIRTDQRSPHMNSHIIVDYGKVEETWNTTNFSVTSNKDDVMSISMPRSYQYFGQYQCACIVADMMNTEISSDTTQMKEVDFMEDLFFKTSIQYKLADNDDSPMFNVSRNVIYLSKSKVDTSFLYMTISMFSLVPDNSINMQYFNGKIVIENIDTDRSDPFYVKAFESIPQSFYVASHKYMRDDVYPEIFHFSNISISSFNPLYKFKQSDVIRIIDEDQVKLKPATWISSDNKTTLVNIMYAGEDEVEMTMKEKSCNATKQTLLATFTREKCITIDPRLTCSTFNKAILVTYKDKTNFAKELTMDVTNSKMNKTVDQVKIKNQVFLNQEDVVIVPRYTSLAPSPKDRLVNVVRVDLHIISKKINDFLPCGSVLVTITEPNKVKRDIILHKSTFAIDVDLDSSTKKKNVTIIITIVGVHGVHVSQVFVQDPKIRIESLSINSSVVGGKRHLRCIADAGSRTQRVEWEIPSTTSLFKTWYPNPSNLTFQDLEMVNSLAITQVTCNLLPVLDDEVKEHVSASFQLNLQSKLVVDGPEQVNVGAAVNFTCLGYPASRNMKLKWMFYSKNSTLAKVVKISDDKLSSRSFHHEPLRLTLDLIDVNETMAGRYECRFLNSIKSVRFGEAPFPGKSISLAVNALVKPPRAVEVAKIEDGNNSKKSAPGSKQTLLAVMVSLFTLVWLSKNSSRC